MLKQVLALSARLREMVTDRVGPPTSTKYFRIRIALAAGLTMTVFSETSFEAVSSPSASSRITVPTAARAMRSPPLDEPPP